MLQQTRVAVVVERYQAFLERFPTLVSLALADEEDVLAQWSGLGYYRRARMLHKAAQFVADHHHGNLPATAEELRMLPGIGAYTAAAIASIAHGERWPWWTATWSECCAGWRVGRQAAAPGAARRCGARLKRWPGNWWTARSPGISTRR